MRSCFVSLAAACALSFTLVPTTAYGQGGTAAPQPPAVLSSTAGEIKTERLATLEKPWGLALLPDGRVLITEKPGRLRIWDKGKLSDPVSGLPKISYRTMGSEQGGLMDVEADPNFASNQLVYISYTEAVEPQPEGVTETGDVRFGGVDMSDNTVRGGVVARGRLDGNQLRDVKVIWRQTPKSVGRGHFGHKLVFATDGKLFITSGDRMRFEPAQSLASNIGKVVRINPDGSIPGDNPFVGKDGQLGDIYSYGHRNVLAAAVDPATSRLWAVEMGPLGGDELNLIQAGKNYGWPLVSNGDHYNNAPIADHPSRREFEQPVRTFTPVISPSGATFYTGTLFPNWRGSMLVGGLSSQAIIRLVLTGEKVAIEERIDMKRRIRDIMQTPDGAILVLTDGNSGELWRLTPAK